MILSIFMATKHLTPKGIPPTRNRSRAGKIIYSWIGRVGTMKILYRGKNSRVAQVRVKSSTKERLADLILGEMRSHSRKKIKGLKLWMLTWWPISPRTAMPPIIITSLSLKRMNMWRKNKLTGTNTKSSWISMFLFEVLKPFNNMKFMGSSGKELMGL